jgi:aspartyl-tRNA(Asn)/glutamyl-tRNA(Gln) amidotransferase subunit A
MEDIKILSAALRAGQLTATALLERCLARIAALDPVLNSFVALNATGARAAAAASDARRAAGQARSELEGIPVSIKDSILVAGLPATWGSRGLADYVPARDELPVARLRAAGAIVLGKTNVPEFTLEGYTRNDLFGVTRNPWDTRLTPGGSSGGAAASVAAGLVAAALGTDGGGSIRRPACHCGLVGFKPSTGHVPRIDGFPAILTDFEVVGTLTRSVDDARALDAVLSGADPRDRRSCYAPALPWAAAPLRIRYVPRFGTAPVDPEVAAATAAVAAALADAGHAVDEADAPVDLEEVARVWQIVSRTGAAWLMAREGGRLAATAGTAARAMATEGARCTGMDIIDALERTTALRRRVAELFETTDLVLTPTAAALPWPAEQPYPTEIAGRPAGPRDHAIFTGWANITGLPAISLPVALSASKLPIGVQFVAPFAGDAALLDFVASVQQRCPAPDPTGRTPYL